MSIYTHPTALGRASDAPDIPKPLPNPLFVRVKCLVHN